MDDPLQYQYDPAGFVANILGERRTVEDVLEGREREADAPWAKQLEIMESVRDNQRTVVPSGHCVGKGLALDTPVPTPNGWSTMGELKQGDRVFDARGYPVLVLEVHAPRLLPCYAVTFDDGSRIVCDRDHLWNTLDFLGRKRVLVKDRRAGQRTDWRYRWRQSKTRGIEDIIATLRHGPQLSHVVPLCHALKLPYVTDLPMDPYVLGIWLGDGTKSQVQVTTPDRYVGEECARRGYRIRWRYPKDRCMQFSILGATDQFRASGVFDKKAIPACYLRAAIHQRLDLLAGLMDSDGWVEHGTAACFTSQHTALTEGVRELAESLGWKARIRKHNSKIGETTYGPYWTVRYVPDTQDIFRLPRKREKLIPPSGKHASRSTARTIVCVERVQSVLTRCILVDSSSKLFLVGRSMIPTHNTHVAARIGLWFLYSRYPAVVLTTAPKQTQVRDQLWARWRGAFSRASVLGGECLTTRCHPLGHDDPEWFAAGYTAKDAEAFQGYHEAHVLIVMDEAPGVGPHIWEAVEGMLSGANVHCLAIGNPVERGGPFYQACRSRLWNCIHISSWDHPNVVHQRMIYPKAVACGWPQERLGEWGEDSPFYVARVLGQHPEEADDTLIRLSWIEAARDRDAQETGLAAVGVDVARFGTDETVFFRACGAWAEMLEAYQGKDLMQTAGRTLRYGAKADRVAVDDTGLGGGITDRCTEQGLDVLAVNNGARANSPDEFADLGSEMMWALRDAFRTTYEMIEGGDDDPTRGISIPNDDVLIHQLSIRRYGYRSTGQIKVESKAEMRRRGERSPDRADALALAWYAKEHRTVPAVSTSDDFDSKAPANDGDWDWRQHSSRPPSRMIGRRTLR